MIKRRLFTTISLVIILFLLHSCKKNSSSPVKHSITYKLTASNYAVFNNISYTDTLGVQSVASAVDSTSGWSKTITESYSGFTMLLQVQGQNSSSSELTYKLEILVDGVSRASEQGSTPAFNSFNTQVSTVIQ